MITDYYYKTTKTRVKETIKEQDRYTTRQRAIKDNTIKTRNSRQRAASASHDKSQKRNSKGATDRLRLYHNRKPRSR
jgi:hypothetical protein